MQEEDEEVANMRRIKRWTVMGMLWALLGLLVIAPGMPPAGGVVLAATVAEPSPVCSARSSGLPAGKTARTTGSTTFQKIYGGTSVEVGRGVVALPDGFLLVGQTNSFGAGGWDMYAVRIDSSGTVQWSKAYGGSGTDVARAVVALSDGFLVVGNTQSFGAGGNDMYAVRIDSSGTVLWSKTYGGSRNDYANAVVGPLADGGFLLVGSTDSFGTAANEYDMYAVRIDKDGNVKWSKTYGGSRIDGGGAVVALSDGFLLVGNTESFGAGENDMYAVRIDGSGNLVWSKAYGGSGDDVARAVVALSDGFLLVGNTKSFGAGGNDMYAVRIDSSGTVQWSKAYGGNKDDVARAVVALPNGDFLLAGNTDSFAGEGDSDMYAVRIDSSGTVLWSKTYVGMGPIDGITGTIPRADDGANAVAGPLTDGGFLLAGWSHYLQADNITPEMYAVRIDEMGKSGDECPEESPATQTTGPATQVASPSTKVKAPTSADASPSTQASDASTNTYTLCQQASTPTVWRLHLPLVLRED